MSTQLDIEVRQALESRRGDWPQIAARADVSHSWISQFVRNKIPNPGFATLKKLHAELVGGHRSAAQEVEAGHAG